MNFIYMLIMCCSTVFGSTHMSESVLTFDMKRDLESMISYMDIDKKYQRNTAYKNKAPNSKAITAILNELRHCKIIT